ncbi:hypothetical protein ACS0ZG_35935, partial [Burkholderia gladioli]|uniref:hypothetical protein n=1 Tax=Burkholderia gladioli TaxID=28095 RepID=UPI003F79E21D
GSSSAGRLIMPTDPHTPLLTISPISAHPYVPAERERGQVGTDELTAMQSGDYRCPHKDRIDAGEVLLGLINGRRAIEKLDDVRKQCLVDQATPRCQIRKQRHPVLDPYAMVFDIFAGNGLDVGNSLRGLAGQVRIMDTCLIDIVVNHQPLLCSVTHNPEVSDWLRRRFDR